MRTSDSHKSQKCLLLDNLSSVCVRLLGLKYRLSYISKIKYIIRYIFYTFNEKLSYYLPTTR